eukprot:COSAG02_NODE_17188_length_1022_cov_2.001083_1_plen_117_part_10
MQSQAPGYFSFQYSLILWKIAPPGSRNVRGPFAGMSFPPGTHASPSDHPLAAGVYTTLSYYLRGKLEVVVSRCECGTECGKFVKTEIRGAPRARAPHAFLKSVRYEPPESNCNSASW